MSGPLIPRNWIYSSQQYATVSDPRGETFASFPAAGQESFSSRARTTPLKFTVDSNSAYARLQRHLLSFRVSLYAADGSPAAGFRNSVLGAMSFIKSVTVKAGGKTVCQVDDYPRHLSKIYARLPVHRKKFLSGLEGYGSNQTFGAGNTLKVAHTFPLGFFFPINGNPLPLPTLPNQAMEITLYLNNIESALTVPGTAAFFTVSEAKFMVQLTTPDAKYVQETFQGLSHNEALRYDYVFENQHLNSFSGATTNNFNLHMSGVHSLIGVQHEFIADADIGTQSTDKALVSKPHNLVSWRIQLGALWSLPANGEFTHSPDDPETMLVGLLSEGNSLNYTEECDMDFDLFKNGQFMIQYYFQSDDEMSSGLSFQGTDGLFKLVTKHSSAPPTSTQLLTTTYENKTLLISGAEGVDVV